MNHRRHAFALAGALTVTALTGALAVAGLSHHASPAPSTSQARVVQVATAPPATAAWADD